MVNVEDAILGAGLTLLGFSFAVVWDIIRERRERSSERRRLLEFLQRETDENAERAQRAIQPLQSAIGFIVTLSPLSTEGWSVAISFWSLLQLNSEVASLLATSYQLARGFNVVNSSREQFQITQNALSTYAQVLSGLNRAAEQKCTEFVQQHKDLKAALERILTDP